MHTKFRHAQNSTSLDYPERQYCLNQYAQIIDKSSQISARDREKAHICLSPHSSNSVLYCFKHASSIIFPRNRINRRVSNFMLDPLKARISAAYITQYTSPHVKTCFGNGFLELSDTLDILYTHVLKTRLKFRSRNLQYGAPDNFFKVVLRVNGFVNSLHAPPPPFPTGKRNKLRSSGLLRSE